jgi:hypothetical protein
MELVTADSSILECYRLCELDRLESFMLKPPLSATLLTAVAFCFPGIGTGQSPERAACLAAVQEASWLAGRWIGQGLGGEVEENWSPAAGCQMFGYFRLVVNGEPVLYEALIIDVIEGELRLRVKHFNSDVTGWEERTDWHTFEPKSSDGNLLAFDGISYRLTAQDSIKIDVQLENEGKVSKQELFLRRAPL